MATKTRFEKETKGNSEMAYYQRRMQNENIVFLCNETKHLALEFKGGKQRENCFSFPTIHGRINN